MWDWTFRDIWSSHSTAYDDCNFIDGAKVLEVRVAPSSEYFYRETGSTAVVWNVRLYDVISQKKEIFMYIFMCVCVCVCIEEVGRSKVNLHYLHQKQSVVS